MSTPHNYITKRNLSQTSKNIREYVKMMDSERETVRIDTYYNKFYHYEIQSKDGLYKVGKNFGFRDNKSLYPRRKIREMTLFETYNSKGKP